MIKDKLLSLPQTSGVYIMKDSQGSIIYIGKAKNLKKRVSQYFMNKKLPIKVASMVENIADFEYILTPSELDAFMLESNLVRKHQPYYNILLKDDKAFPYIKIDLTKDFPRPEITRRITDKKSKYFGPYFNGIRANDLMKIINNNFLIRKCANLHKNASRECLNYHLGLCSAPCTNKVSKEDYRKIISSVIDFLKGNDNIEDRLKCKMDECAKVQNYERALELRDCIAMLSKMKERAIDRLPKTVDIDAWGWASADIGCATLLVIRAGKMIGIRRFEISSVDGFDSSLIMQYYSDNIPPSCILLPMEIESQETLAEAIKRDKKVEIKVPTRGVNKKLVLQAVDNALEYVSKVGSKEKKIQSALADLKDKLHLSRLPYRIECYDISHISGVDKVASMVVSIDGEKATKYYRKFKIKTVEGVDDFASLDEAISRRLQRIGTEDISFGVVPDLIVIDGGKGQLSTCQEMITSRGIDVVSLAKREEEVFTTWSNEPVIISKRSPTLHILQNIRDEAHRFAITFHRSLRSKRQTKSALDEIEGLGPVKKKALMDKFGTVSAIKTANVADLVMVKGIDESLAERIFKKFN